MRRILIVACGLLLVNAAGCKDDDKKDSKEKKAKDDTKGEKAGDEGEPSLEVASGDPPVEGPVPPETSMIFFTVEGALYPLACFDKEKGQMRGGPDCLDMVQAGAEVRLHSTDAEYNKVAQDRVEPQCLAGSGKNVALGVEGITQGADFIYGVWPRSSMKVVKAVSDETTSPSETRLGDDKIEKLQAAIKGAGGRDGEVKAHQVAEIDLDGNDKKEKVYSVYIPDENMSEQYAWSGIFLAKDGNLDDLILLDKSKTKRDVFEVRGTLDLDGKDQKELWMRLVFAEGAGDRIVTFEGNRPKPIGPWSCGAV